MKEPDSPTQKTKSDISNDDADVVVEDDTEEGGYKSDRSASDDGSTDAVVDRRRNKGSSGYEESGEEDGVSEISEGYFLVFFSPRVSLVHIFVWNNPLFHMQANLGTLMYKLTFSNQRSIDHILKLK